MSRHKDVDWSLAEDAPADQVTIAILMDIRDELKIISKVLTCHNTYFTGILARKKENDKGKKK